MKPSDPFEQGLAASEAAASAAGGAASTAKTGGRMSSYAYSFGYINAMSVTVKGVDAITMALYRPSRSSMFLTPGSSST